MNVISARSPPHPSARVRSRTQTARLDLPLWRGLHLALWGLSDRGLRLDLALWRGLHLALWRSLYLALWGLPDR